MIDTKAKKCSGSKALKKHVTYHTYHIDRTNTSDKDFCFYCYWCIVFYNHKCTVMLVAVTSPHDLFGCHLTLEDIQQLVV